MKKNTFFILAATFLFLNGLQTVNAQGILNKIKKKTEEITKPTQTNQTAQTIQSEANKTASNGKINVRDIFKEAAPLLQITASENVDNVISQTFENENRIIFKVPANLAMSTEGTMRANGEAKVFPTKTGGGMFAVTYTACTVDNMCDNQFQLIQIENGNAQLVTGLHLASYYTSNDMIINLLKANKNYKKPVGALYKANINFNNNKLNMVVDCPDGLCQNAFVVRSFTFDGEKFVEAK
ncbi:MAG TPA: hypothetical protein PKY59_10430 [Pyrinomonadaceae bacterium]|nr:hypothetical protein [Pyrinomonadaceae bacterium]